VALEGELVEHVWEAVQTCWKKVVFFGCQGRFEKVR